MSAYIHLRGEGVDQFVYNLGLVAPGKGEAKKSSSGGRVLIGYEPVNDLYQITGYATDDLLSVQVQLPGLVKEPGALWGEATVDELKMGGQVPIDPNFNEALWIEGVRSSILHGVTLGYSAQEEFAVDPNRLRKFSLLEPRSHFPLDFKWAEWNYRSILKWKMGPNVRGSFATLDRSLLDSELMW